MLLTLFVALFPLFQPGSALSISDRTGANVAAHAAVTTTLSAASGACSSLLLRWIVSDPTVVDITAAINGALSGLVAITAGCATVYPWAGETLKKQLLRSSWVIKSRLLTLLLSFSSS